MHGGEGRRTRPTGSRGQAETIGVVLILAMTLIGATVALAFGATALNAARADSHEEGVRNAMTQLDSRSARVALGDSTTQRVTLASGSYHVDPDAGWINITHLNHTGGGHDQTLYNDSLGAVIYNGDEVTIAYQGGGVWQSSGAASRMVSPPEFHYRGSTLTLPVVRLASSDSGSGPMTAQVTSSSELVRIYPNEEVQYDENSAPYANPVMEGNVSVTIHSDYYQAWADYFRTRTAGDVTVYHGNETVELLLLTPDTLGDFTVPQEGNDLSIRQLGDEHPVDQFNITLEAKNPGAGGPNNFNGMEWSFSTDGVQEFEIHFTGSPCANNNPNLDINLYYHNGSGTYQGWTRSFDPTNGSQNTVSVVCGAGTLTIDLMATDALSYEDDIDTTFDTSSLNFDTQARFDQHVPPDGPSTYVEGDGAGIGFIVNHYLEELGPNVDLTVVDDGGGGNAAGQVNEPDSFGELDYEQGGGPRYITFLHITENNVTVTLD